jgi:hypothetical protein
MAATGAHLPEVSTKSDLTPMHRRRSCASKNAIGNAAAQSSAMTQNARGPSAP